MYHMWLPTGWQMGWWCVRVQFQVLYLNHFRQIYRYLVIFRNTRQFPLWMVMLIPVLAYLTSFCTFPLDTFALWHLTICLSALSVVWLVQVSAPASSPWSNAGAINFTAPYFWMSLSLNISMTFAICARLLFYRRRVSSVLGPNHGTQYTSVAAMIVESASLYSAFALLFLIPFALNNPIQNTFIQLMGEIQVSIAIWTTIESDGCQWFHIQIIATLLITYRVAYGAAWASGTSQTILGTKETQNSGVRVQVEFSGPHEGPLNHSSSLAKTQSQGQSSEYEMGKCPA